MILAENDYRGQLFKAFVEPFVDVAQSAKLFSQDVLNSLRLAFDTLVVAFSPKELREARDKYKERRDKIAREWEPLMKKAGESLSADVGLVAMVVAPNLFFGAQALKLGGKAPRTVADYLETAGWKVPILSAFASSAGSKWGKSLDEKFEEWLDSEERKARGREEERGRSGIAGQLRVFFFGEAAWHHGDLLSEAEGDEKKDEPAQASQLRDALDEMVREFLEPALAPAREELLTAKREQAEALLKPANSVIRGLRGLAAAGSMQELESTLSSMQSSLGDSADLSAVREAIESLRASMQEKAGEVKGKQGPAPEGSKPEDVEAVASAAASQAFKQASGELREMASEAAKSAVENYREAIAKELMSDLPTEGAAAEALKGSETGSELLELIKGAVDSVGS